MEWELGVLGVKQRNLEMEGTSNLNRDPDQGIMCLIKTKIVMFRLEFLRSQHKLISDQPQADSTMEIIKILMLELLSNLKLIRAQI